MSKQLISKTRYVERFEVNLITWHITYEDLIGLNQIYELVYTSALKEFAYSLDSVHIKYLWQKRYG